MNEAERQHRCRSLVLDIGGSSLRRCALWKGHDDDRLHTDAVGMAWDRGDAVWRADIDEGRLIAVLIERARRR